MDSYQIFQLEKYGNILKENGQIETENGAAAREENDRLFEQQSELQLINQDH